MNFEISNVRALQIFQILRQGAAILISILLTKTALSTDEIGVFEMLTFMGTSVSFFWIGGLNQGILPLFPTLEKEQKDKFIFDAFLLISGISIFVILLLFIFEKPITLAFTGQTALPYFKWYATYLLFFLPSFLIEYFYLVKQMPKKILYFGIIAFTLQVVVVIAPILLGWGLLGAIYGLVGLGVFRFLWLVHIVFRFGKMKWDAIVMSNYLRLSSPLILYALLSGFPAFFDNWIVGWFFEDKSTFAIFRYGARELPLAIALAGAFGAAMIPEVVKDMDSALVDIQRKSLVLYHLLFPLSIALMLTSGWWFPIVFNPNFVESVPVFNVFLLIIISRLIFPQTILIALGKTKMALYISILETILNAVLSLILVQFYGLIGIAWGTVIAYLFEKIAIAAYLSSKHKIPFSKYTPVKWLLFYSLILIASHFF